MSNTAVKSSTPGTLAIATLLIASTMTIMAGATIAPSLPGMKDVFATSGNVELRVRLVLTITSLAIAVSAPFLGALGDSVGRTKVLLGSVLLYMIAGTSGLYLQDLNHILIGRIILGIAVAGVMTSTSALVGDLFVGPARAKMLGLQGAAGGFGGVIFLGLGGLLASYNWRGPFWIYLLPLVLLVLIPLVSRSLQPTSPVVQHAKSTSAALPTSTMLTVYATGFILMLSFYALPVQLPFLLAERGYTSPLFSGASLSGMTLVSALLGIFYGRLTQGYSFTALSIAASAFIGIGIALIAAVASLFAITVLGLIAVGIGMAVMMPTLSGWLLSATAPEQRGKVMGGFASAMFLGHFVSPLALQPIIARRGLDAAYLLAAGLALLVSVGLWLRSGKE
jgi:MFS family permease